MPWNPGVQFMGGQMEGAAIANAASTISQDFLKAWQRYENDKKQTDYNTGVFESIKDDPNMSKYVPTDALARWHSMNPDKQAGTLAGIARRAEEDLKQQQIDRQQSLTDAQQNLIEAQAHNEWAGGTGAQEQPFVLSPETIAAGKSVGKVPLPTSPRSYQWAEDPNAPANLGMAEPMPIDKFGRRVDAANPSGEVVGLQGQNGQIHMFPKPSQIQELINAGVIKPPTANPNATPAATPKPTPTPSPTPSPTATAAAAVKKVRVKSPTGQSGMIPADRLKDYQAAGWTVLE